MSTQPKATRTSAEYLAIERVCENKHEFYRGEMFAMSGASAAHNRIMLNLVTSLVTQLREKPCDVFASDMRVKVSASGLYTYPDGIVTCEEPQFEDAEVDTLLNPQMIFEILSKSTESYDRGKKFEHYRQIPSLKNYILISQNHLQIEHFARQDDGQWLLSEASGPEATLELPTIDGSLSLAELYTKVKFPEQDPPS